MSKPKTQPKADLRRGLKIVAFVCFVAAAVLGARAYFLTHPPAGAPFSESSDQLNQNPLTNIDSVNTDLNNSHGAIWGDAITDAFATPATDGLWLEVNNHQNLYLGELTTTGFKSGFTLPANAANLKLYATGDLLYITPSTNTTDAKLSVVSDDQTTDLLRLESGWEFNSVFFEPQQKQFYVDIYDHNGDAKLQVLRQGGQPLDIAGTAAYSAFAILNIDSGSHMLYFSATVGGNVACHSLNTVSKEFADVNCASFKSGSLKYAFSTNGAPSPLAADFKGRILQTDLSSGNQQIFKQGNAGDVYGPLNGNDNFLAVLYSKIGILSAPSSSSGSTSTLSLTPNTLQLYESGSHAFAKEFTAPPVNILNIFAGAKGNIWLVTNEDAGQRLWQQPPTTAAEWTALNLGMCTQVCEYSAL